MLGYSVWLELAQTDRDLEKAVGTAALEKSVWPIPEPHCTVAYGIEMDEEEARKCFLEKVVPNIRHWPALKPKGRNCGVCFEGVQGEEMDMSWIELALHSSQEHQELVDKVYSCFDNAKGDPARAVRWQPHVSIAYDGPLDTVLDDVYSEKIFAKYPTLLGTKSRRVKAISLWRTKGKLWDWACLEKTSLN